MTNPISSAIQFPTSAAPGITGTPAGLPVSKKGDSVELSAAALNMKKAQDEFDSSPEVRIRVVEELKQKIHYNGYPYKSDFYKSVEKLLPVV
jgi:hypothetical protein